MRDTIVLGQGLEAMVDAMERELVSGPKVVIRVRDRDLEPIPEPTEVYLHEEPRVKDWEQRNYRRPRQKRKRK